MIWPPMLQMQKGAPFGTPFACVQPQALPCSGNKCAIIPPRTGRKKYDFFVAGSGAIPRSNTDRTGHRARFSVQGCQCSDTTQTSFFHDIRHLDFPLFCLIGASFFRHVCDLNLTCCPIVAERWRDCAQIPFISRSCCDNFRLCHSPLILSKKTGISARKRSCGILFFLQRSRNNRT
jgi:hypothetical protein